MWATAAVLLAGCATDHAMTREGGPKRMHLDRTYVNAVEREASARWITVHWMNPPRGNERAVRGR